MTNSADAAATVDMTGDVAQLVVQINDPEKRDAAADALKKQGKDALPKLTELLASGDWQVRAAAVFAIGQLGADAKDALPTLKKLAEEDDSEAVRSTAKYAVDSIAPPAEP